MSSTSQGFLFVVGSIVIASGQSVFLSRWLAGINVYLVIFLSFTIVLLLYCVIGVSLGRHWFAKLKSMKKELILLNLVSAGNWLFYFLAIKYMNPSVIVSITQCLPPVIITVYLIANKKFVSRSTIVFHTCILFTIIALIYSTLSVPQVGYQNSFFGGAVAILCAITVSATIGISKSFSNKGLPSYIVLSTRFPLLIAISFFLLPGEAWATLTLEDFAVITLIAIVGLSLANILLQKGIERTTPTIVSTTLSISPFVVLVFDKISRSNFSVNLQSTLVSVIVVLSLLCIYMENRNNKLINPNV